jgi:NAD(P)-dependent dehydrogenase (short-subunit alcohol dehydrogenase family)
MTDISGKVAVVTGGGSGIGRALCLQLAAEGASVVICDILAENADSVAAEVEVAGGTALPVVCDVSDEQSVEAMRAQARAALGHVSLLFANAGAATWGRLAELPQEEVAWMFEVNLMGVVSCLRAFLPDMIKAGDGHVCATASFVGLCPAVLPQLSPYASAKSGVIATMLALRAELAESGVGASVLIPSGVRADMYDQDFMIKNSSRYRPQRFGPGGPPVAAPDVVRQMLKDSPPVIRPAEEVAEMALLAVRHNRPVVVTCSTNRATFQQSFVDVITTAFDDLDEFERTLASRS